MPSTPTTLPTPTTPCTSMSRGARPIGVVPAMTTRPSTAGRSTVIGGPAVRAGPAPVPASDLSTTAGRSPDQRSPSAGPVLG